MRTPDRSQNAFRQTVARLMKPVAGVLGSLALSLPGAMLSAATVEYDLTITRQAINFTGHPVQAMLSMANCRGRPCDSLRATVP